MSGVDGFIKLEFVLAGKLPHFISSRNLASRVITGPVLFALQNALKGYGRFICGCTNAEAADRVARACAGATEGERTTGVGVFECDFKAFDASQSVWVLRQLYERVYRKLIRAEPQFWRAIYAQPISKVSIRGRDCGIRARFIKLGGRASGDTDTYIGNSILNYALHVAADMCSQARQGVAEPIARDVNGVFSGDDSVVFHSGLTAEDFRVFGFNPKCHNRNSLADSTFCSSLFYPRIIDGEMGSTLLRNPGKSLRRFNCSVYNLPRDVAKERFKEKLYAEIVANNGIPILGELFRALGKKNGFKCPGFSIGGIGGHEVQSLYYRALGPFDHIEPCVEARKLFAYHFHVSVEEQQQIEEALRCGISPYSFLIRDVFQQIADRADAVFS